MTLPTIQSLWIGKDLSNFEKLCVQSFLDHGHEFHLYTYADIGGVPAGATVKDANEIVPENEIYTVKKFGIAAFSDYFRYNLLAKKGNWWVDMDMVCLKPFEFSDELVFCGCREYAGENSPLKVPQGHVFATTMAKHKTQTYAEALAHLWRTIDGLGLQKYCKAYMYFLCLEHIQFFGTSFPQGIDFGIHTYAIHIKNSSVEALKGFDKNAKFHERSAFELLKQKHGIITRSDAPDISATMLLKMVNSAQKLRTDRRRNRIKRERLLFLLIAFLGGFTLGAFGL